MLAPFTFPPVVHSVLVSPQPRQHLLTSGLLVTHPYEYAEKPFFFLFRFNLYKITHQTLLQFRMLQGYNNLKEFKLLPSTSEFIPLQTNDRYFPNWPQSVGQNLSISAMSSPGGEEQRWSEPTFTELLLSGTTCNVMKPAQVNIVIMPSLLMRKQWLMPVGKEVAKIAVKGS